MLPCTPIATQTQSYDDVTLEMSPNSNDPLTTPLNIMHDATGISPGGFLYDNNNNNSSNNIDATVSIGNVSKSQIHYLDSSTHILRNYVTTSICLIGMIGNIITLTVLLQKNFLRKFGKKKLEQSSLQSIVALSLADLFFCVFSLPQYFLRDETEPLALHYSFNLLYHTYHSALINIFVLLSTWLTVTMAIQRFLLICHPIRARSRYRKMFTKYPLIFVAILCGLFTFPRFFFRSIHSVDCMEGYSVYFSGPAWFHKVGNSQIRTTYLVLYFVVAIFIPFLILVYCNLNLILALKHSATLRRNSAHTRWARSVSTSDDSGKTGSGVSASNDASSRLTLTFIIIIIMTLLLVLPVEVMTFLSDLAYSPYNYRNVINFVSSLLNATQAVNFSANFILYCSLNSQFRRSFQRCASRNAVTVPPRLTLCCRRGDAAAEYGPVIRHKGTITSQGTTTLIKEEITEV